jgi:hypothetical protein
VGLINWLPHGASFNEAYFDENILQPMASELHTGEKKKHCPWPLLHMDNTRPHTSKQNLARTEALRLKRVAHPPFSFNIALSDFFSLAGSKANSLLERSARLMDFLKSSSKF